MRGVWRDTKWWTRPTRTTTNWPLINLGLPSLFLEMSVCQLLYFGIFILICPNMLCAMSVDSACAYFESWGSSVAWRWFSRMWPMSWWRWTSSEWGACSFIIPSPSGLRAKETLYPFYSHLLLRTFQQPNPFCCNRSTTSQLVHNFLSQQNNRLFLRLSELMDLIVAGRDQSAADQPNYLAEGHLPF